MPYIVDSSKPSGTIEAYGGAAAPDGFLLCDGTSLLRASYPALFAAIGTAFGAADGTHFNVPDLRGRFLRGVDGGAARDPDAAGRVVMATGGNTANNVGSVQGGQFAAHGHDIYGGNSGGAVTTPGNASSSSLSGSSGAGGLAYITNAPVGGNAYIKTQGGNETRPINAYVTYIIKI